MDKYKILKTIVRLGYIAEFVALIVMLVLKLSGREITEAVAWVFFVGLCIAAFGTLYIMQSRRRDEYDRKHRND